jgi:hypothetical protein
MPEALACRSGLGIDLEVSPALVFDGKGAGLEDLERLSLVLSQIPCGDGWQAFV